MLPRIRFFLAFLSILSLGNSARAQGRDVITALSRDVINDGDSVSLVYRFVNVPEPENIPQTLSVDGLDITFLGAQTQRSMNFSFGNGGLRDQSETAIEYTYVVRAERSGDFTIPGFEVRAGNRSMKTKPARLRVVGTNSPTSASQTRAQTNASGAALDPFQLLNQMLQGGSVQIPLPGSPGFPLPTPQPDSPPPSPAGDGGEFFAEMTLGTNAAFVGQVVPVDLRFYFPADMVRDGWEPPDPQFSGDGFTVTSVGRPKRADAERNGANHRVYTFRTAIVPAKTGELQIPPAKVGIQLIGGMFGRQEEIEVTTDSKKLRVEALPEEGRPISFSGAIGQNFELSADVDPPAAEAGEPLTYSLTISGRGNFDAIVAPELNSTAGWRIYPPKEEFEADDTSGFGGSKTFRFKMVAKHAMNATPGAEFSYFDPEKRQYVTLKVSPLAVAAKSRESSSIVGQNETAPPRETSSSDFSEEIHIATTSNAAATPSFGALWLRWIKLAVGLALVLALPLGIWWARRRKGS